ncbi:MAG: ketoacyl-ACP synthase III [Ichthyobacteriaceae bacterium]|nr:ketoacyl-ACP synthase III [Ichthyobacteriaceae bacterium]
MSNITAAITAVGGYVPDYVMTNKELETMVDTNDEWIRSRTGIEERRILKEEGAGTSFMAIKAGNEIIEKSGIDAKDIDLVIVTTATPDMNVASTASHVATQIGAVNAFGYDISAACSGFVYGLSTGSAFIESGKYKKVIVIGADKMSSIVDYTDRNTCIIFGDGAGGVLLEPNTEGYGLQDEYLRSDSVGREFLNMEAGGSLLPPSHETVDNRQHFIRQDGRTVFKYAVSKMTEAATIIAERNDLNSDNITWLAAHQANKRIINAISSRLNLKDEQVMMNIEKYGNTTNGTIPLLLWDYEEKLKKGDKIIIAAFGGGFTWGSQYLTWAY